MQKTTRCAPRGRASKRPVLARRLLATLGLTAGLVLAALPAREATAAVTIGQSVPGIVDAENSIQTSTGRIFVSSDGYLYELRKDAAGVWAKTAVPAVYPYDVYSEKPERKDKCYYLGLTEYANSLYSVCARDNVVGAPKYLMVLDLTLANPSLWSMWSINADVELPNGLASDGRGNLFFANTTLPILLKKQLPGNIQRIQLSGRYTVAGQTIMDTPAIAALNPNGMKFHGGQLYVTANPVSSSGDSLLVRFPVSSAGALGTPWTIHTSTTFLDDFSLVQGGMVLIEWITGSMKFINEAGGLMRSYQYPLSLPTSATVLKPGTAPGNAVLVTSMASDKAVFLETDWPIAPR